MLPSAKDEYPNSRQLMMIRTRLLMCPAMRPTMIVAVNAPIPNGVIAIPATIAILPLFMQNLLHYTALAAGMAMTPFGIGAFTSTIIVGRLAGHLSNRVRMIISCLLFGYSSFALGNINLQVAPANLLWPII